MKLLENHLKVHAELVPTKVGSLRSAICFLAVGSRERGRLGGGPASGPPTDARGAAGRAAWILHSIEAPGAVASSRARAQDLHYQSGPESLRPTWLS